MDIMIIDAFRHTAWNALNAKDLGAAEAKRFGDAHEAKEDQPDVERNMDLNNNEIGRSIGAANSHLSDNRVVQKPQFLNNFRLKMSYLGNAKVSVTIFVGGDGPCGWGSRMTW
jgi:hypothetical protein